LYTIGVRRRESRTRR
jgi:hypothetical protein